MSIEREGGRRKEAIYICVMGNGKQVGKVCWGFRRG